MTDFVFGISGNYATNFVAIPLHMPIQRNNVEWNAVHKMLWWQGNTEKHFFFARKRSWILLCHAGFQRTDTSGEKTESVKSRHLSPSKTTNLLFVFSLKITHALQKTFLVCLQLSVKKTLYLEKNTFSHFTQFSFLLLLYLAVIYLIYNLILIYLFGCPVCLCLPIWIRIIQHNSWIILITEIWLIGWIWKRGISLPTPFPFNNNSDYFPCLLQKPQPQQLASTSHTNVRIILFASYVTGSCWYTVLLSPHEP